MRVSEYLYKKIGQEMRLIYITERKPKQKIRLDPIDPEDINIDLDVLNRWSSDNKELYDLVIENGMAEFICNREFLNEHYKTLQFMYAGLKQIDPSTTLLTNLKVLNLFNNNISNFQNIPPNCVELYLDFNKISSCTSRNKTSIELLSLSNNQIDDTTIEKIIRVAPNLRCLNVAFNLICDLRRFISNLKRCSKLKILICFNNPISMLWLYWDQITEQVNLDYFDNQKYVKPQPEIQVPVEEPVQEKKQEKKDSKNAKKGGKVEEKPPEPEPAKQIVYKEPRKRNQIDFQISHLKINCGIFQGFTGNLYDTSLFPQENLDLKNTQTSFWLEVFYLDKQYSTYESRISMDEVTIDNETKRLQFELCIDQEVKACIQMMGKLDKGLKIEIWKEEPKVTTNEQSGEEKVQIADDKVQLERSFLGGTYIDLRLLYPMRIKKIQRNCTLFSKEAIDSPLFQRPYENEEQLIKKHKLQFDAKLAELEEEQKKKIEEEQAAKAQKKGGKDSKKGADKKGAKKEGKEAPSDRKNINKSSIPLQLKQYCYLGENKMYKSLKDHSLTVLISLE